MCVWLSFQTEKKPFSLHYVGNNIFVMHDTILHLMTIVRSVLDSMWVVALCCQKSAM